MAKLIATPMPTDGPVINETPPAFTPLGKPAPVPDEPTPPGVLQTRWRWFDEPAPAGKPADPPFIPPPVENPVPDGGDIFIPPPVENPVPDGGDVGGSPVALPLENPEAPGSPAADTPNPAPTSPLGGSPAPTPPPLGQPFDQAAWQSAYSFVDGLYREYLMGVGSTRTGPDEAINVWVNMLMQGTATREQVRQGFENSTEFQGRVAGLRGDLLTRLGAYASGFSTESVAAYEARFSLRSFWNSLGVVKNHIKDALPSWLTGADVPLPLGEGSGGGGTAPSPVVTPPPATTPAPTTTTPPPTTEPPVPTLSTLLGEIFGSGGSTSSTPAPGSSGSGQIAVVPQPYPVQSEAAPGGGLSSRLNLVLIVLSIIATAFTIRYYMKKKASG